MSRLERKTLKSLANIHNVSKRFRVELPDLPQVRLLVDGPEQAWNEDWDEWNRQVEERKADALYALAKERDADVHELAKVSDLLLEVVPPKFTGREGIDRYPVLLLVALEIHNGRSQRVACELVGVDRKTFRKYTKIDRLGWKIALNVVSVLPESKIRELARMPPGE